MDYKFRSIIHPSILPIDSSVDQSETNHNYKSKRRIGHKKYRMSVFNHMPQCSFTLITDDSLLRASHIKPYSVCMAENQPKQAVDYLNGLTFTPTYDWLFDQGHISFSDEGCLICGTRLSNYTWEKLHINPNFRNKMRIYPEGRESYLDFHRKFIFQN